LARLTGGISPLALRVSDDIFARLLETVSIRTRWATRALVLISRADIIDRIPFLRGYTRLY